MRLKDRMRTEKAADASSQHSFLLVKHLLPRSTVRSESIPSTNQERIVTKCLTDFRKKRLQQERKSLCPNLLPGRPTINQRSTIRQVFSIAVLRA